MNFRAGFFLFAIVATAGFAAAPVRDPSQTELKIRLMAEALTARDAGDFVTAKQKLEALTQVVPNDPGVRRLIADVEAKEADRLARLANPLPPPQASAPEIPSEAAPAIAAASSDTPVPPSSVASASAPVPAPSGRPSAGSTRSSSTPSNPRPSTPPGRTEAVEQVAGMPVIVEGHASTTPTPPDRYAEALANVEKEGVAFARAGDDQLEKLMTYVQAQRALARVYAHDGNFAAATATLAEAQASLESSLNDIRSEKRGYILKQVEAQEAKKGIRLRHRR